MICVRPTPATPMDLARERLKDLAHDQMVDVDIADLRQLLKDLGKSPNAETEDSQLPWTNSAEDFVAAVLDGRPYAPPQVAEVLWKSINSLIDEAMPVVEASAHEVLKPYSPSVRRRLMDDAREAAAEEVLYRLWENGD